MRVCSYCKEKKPNKDFYKSKHHRAIDGYDYYCKYCRTGKNLKSHRSKTRKCSLADCVESHYAKGYCRAHYARLVRNGTTDRQNTKIDVTKPYLYNGGEIERRAYSLLTKYKMTIEEYTERSSKGCEICGVKTKHNLQVDHDHRCCNGGITCGKCVRGIICPGCNVAVDKYDEGLLRNDNPKIKLIEKYIVKYHG